MEKSHNDEFQSIRTLRVIEVNCARGKGTQDDLLRPVYFYYELNADGSLEFLFFKDPTYERQSLTNGYVGD